MLFSVQIRYVPAVFPSQQALTPATAIRRAPSPSFSLWKATVVPPVPAPPGGAVDDAYLVARAQEGYLDAFEALVARHGPRAFRVALRLVNDRAEAEDLTQEALVAAWQALPRFRADAAFSTWLLRIVTNRCLNHLTRTRQTVHLDAGGELTDSAPGPADRAVAAASRDAVGTAIAALPIAYRVPLVLREFEGLSYQQIALVTTSTVPAVRSQLARARRTLATALEQWR